MVGGGMTLDIKQVYRPESVLFGSVTYSLGGCPVTLNRDLQDTTELISPFTLYSQIMSGLPNFFHLKTTFPSNPKGEGQGRWEGLPLAALTVSLTPVHEVERVRVVRREKACGNSIVNRQTYTL